MKYIYLSLVFSLFFASVFAQNPIVGTPIRIDRLEFAQKDFSKPMSWKEAKVACASLGQGWRLPSVSELMLLGQNTNIIQLSSFYWCIDENQDYDFPFSLTNYSNNPSSLSMERNRISSKLDFWLNKETDLNKLFYVRAVRNYSPPFTKNQIVGTPIRLNSFEIAQFDFPALMTWDQAYKACESLGDGWRLANSFEMGIIFQNAKTDTTYEYWVSDQINISLANKRDSAFYFNNDVASINRLSGIYQKNEFGNARAVRGSYSPSSDLNKIIGVPIKVENMIIAQHDFPESMHWFKAKLVCNSLGEGWRLPNLEEVKILKKNSQKIGLKDNDYSNYWIDAYWKNDSTYSFNVTEPENSLLGSLNNDLSTRCIKVAYKNKLKNKVVGNTFRFGDLEIAQFDFPREMTRKEALIECVNLGDGWRLPNDDEFRFILTLDRYDLMKLGLNGSAYWTFNEGVNDKPSYTCDCFGCCCDEVYGGYDPEEITTEQLEENEDSMVTSVRVVRNY
jgi:hypothetical protein